MAQFEPEFGGFGRFPGSGDVPADTTQADEGDKTELAPYIVIPTESQLDGIAKAKQEGRTGIAV